jgi:molecular chaperone GrpE
MSDSIPPAQPNENDPPADAVEARGDTIADEGEGGDSLAGLRDELAKAKDAWMRTAADFDNFRKRTRREIEDAKKSGREDLLRAVLPVFDNIERAIQSAQRATDVKAVADGLSMVLRQFGEALARTGIQKVPTIGTPFDPGVHEAIQQVETSDHPPGTVIAEVQPGYVQGDRLIRAAMVVVAKPKTEETPAEKN